jgi:hypothetical protein
MKQILQWILYEMPDLKFWIIPTHPRYFLKYGERINGRLAMLVLVAVLWLEFISKTSIWKLVNVF